MNDRVFSVPAQSPHVIIKADEATAGMISWSRGLVITGKDYRLDELTVTARSISMSLSYVMSGHTVSTLLDGEIEVFCPPGVDIEKAERRIQERLPSSHRIVRHGPCFIRVISKEQS